MSDIIRIPCGSVNAFLIKEKEHAVLVDTGLAGYDYVWTRSNWKNTVLFLSKIN